MLSSWECSSDETREEAYVPMQGLMLTSRQHVMSRKQQHQLAFMMPMQFAEERQKHRQRWMHKRSGENKEEFSSSSSKNYSSHQVMCKDDGDDGPVVQAMSSSEEDISRLHCISF
ncbi:hypothetical protein L7F22_064748 [Adiantum nelumboides]|nr:hypothetical protein [Adiantum nelumboides]